MKERMMASTTHLQAAANGLANREVIASLTKAIDKALGPNSSRLIFDTMHLIYHLDRTSIPSKLDVFEQTLRRIVRNATADVVINRAIADMTKNNGSFIAPHSQNLS
jgi:hypothetical protein